LSILEVYARVRRAVQVDGMSIRQAAREFGLARKTIRKMLQHSLPPGYARKKPVRRPMLGPWLGIIDQILVEDRLQPKKQRHTAKRIFDRLKAEHALAVAIRFGKITCAKHDCGTKKYSCHWRIRPALRKPISARRSW
jgi:transposase